MTPPPHNTRRLIIKENPAASSSVPFLKLDTQDACQKYSNERNLPLRKSATFHSPTSLPSQDDDPILSIPLLPRRSPTCPKALEDAVAAGEKRVANILGVYERSLLGSTGSSSDTPQTLCTEDLPVPRFMIDAHVGQLDHMDIDQAANHRVPPPRGQRLARKHHTSDSGIGSTVTDSEELCEPRIKIETTNSPSTISGIQSGINGSGVSHTGFQTGIQHMLSESACRQIQKHIILPIVGDNSLKNFHPLVSGIPYRVARKEITCLRDLEKVLLFSAPKWSAGSRASFIKFCETSIQCIHTTVDYLNEPDLRRSTDAPYTNGYFLDLTEQIRQYAAMITASRERMAAGREPTEHDYTTDETVKLEGGLGQTGRPAELVRVKNGQSISLRTGAEFQPECGTGFERAMDVDDDEITRSMARRRKSAPAVPKNVECSECHKEFKRPCDLTKHEKTHSRPWKCSEPTCKYHTYGWPTEKEKDRHVNDKHSTTPSMHKCKFHPCPYESKRESNCKQHMEKAHGWAYVRSRNNGKLDRKAQSVKTPPTPEITTPGSCIFDVSSPEYGVSSSHIGSNGFSVAHSVSGSVAASEDSLPHSANATTWMEPALPSFTPNYAWNESLNDFTSNGCIEEYSPLSHHHPWDAESVMNAPNASSPLETSLDSDPNFPGNFDWSNMNTDLTSFNMQLFTPAHSVGSEPLDAFSRNPSISLEKGQVPSLSPGAQGNVMFYSPYSNNDSAIDEGYDDFPSDLSKPCTDFPLFDSPNSSSTRSADQGNMFDDLETIPTAWPRGTDLLHQFNIHELMQVDD